MLQSRGHSNEVTKYLAAYPAFFQSALHKFLRNEVLNIILTDGTWSVGSILRDSVVDALVENIFKWLLGEELEESFILLQKLNGSPPLCGRVFKSGEPTYSCRDCAMDPTCVLCQQCFWQSEHSKHRYKIHTSGGGGCCDCGDPEAWRKFYACRLHARDSVPNESEEALSRLPKEIQERAPFFFETILQYVVEFLTKEKTNVSDLSPSLRPTKESSFFATVLYNDESHTFDFVIEILKEALKCDEATGANFATVVDREGRSVVCISNEQECRSAGKVISSKPSSILPWRTSKPLKTLVVHESILAHQELALRILPFLSKVVQQSEGLREIFCEVAMRQNAIHSEMASSHHEGTSAVEQLMRCDHELWKTARNQYITLVMNSLLLTQKAKKDFAVLFTRLYGVLEDGFMNGDHDHGQSVTSLSVQLFTVPSIARYLIEHEDVLGVILRSFTNSCYESPPAPDSKEWCQVLKTDTRKMRVALRRLSYIFHDLRYVFAITPTEWTPNLKSMFLQGLQHIMQFMMSVHGMDGYIRKLDTHVEHDPDWETGTTMMMRLYPIISSLVKWLGTDVDLLLKALRLGLLALKQIMESGRFKMINVMYYDVSYKCVSLDVTKEEVSTHYPISRFIAAILVKLGKAGLTWQEINTSEHVKSLMNDSLIRSELLEFSLRCLCLNAQVNCGMWKRNGLALVNQLSFYKDHRCREEAFDRDIQMLQVCASCMNPDHFIANLLNRMKISDDKNESTESHARLFGELFALLIAVVSERYVSGISDVSLPQQIRRELIHILAAEPKPRSKIVKILPDYIDDNCDWELVLQEVADFREPTGANTVGKYSLKSEAMVDFSPYSYQYVSPVEETKAKQTILRKKISCGMPAVFLPPKCPRFTRLFRNVPYILCSDLFIKIMSKFLQNLINSDPETWTDRVIGRGLYLLALAVCENHDQIESNSATDFKFLQKAISGCENSILFLLKQIKAMESYSGHSECVAWLISEIEKITPAKSDDASGSSVDMPAHGDVTTSKEGIGSKNARKRKAQEQRSRLLSQMKMMQQNFLSQNPDLILGEESRSSMDLSPEIKPSVEVVSPVCMDFNWQLNAFDGPDANYTCILCQEESQSSEGIMVMSALVQRSKVLSRGPCDDLSLDDLAPLFLDISFPHGIHASTCSHTMHYECFKQFKKSARRVELRRSRHRSRRAVETTEIEFYCPLCSRLSNTVMPIVSHKFMFKQRAIVRQNHGEVDRSSHTIRDEQMHSKGEWLKSVENMVDVVYSTPSQGAIACMADTEKMEYSNTQMDRTMSQGVIDDAVLESSQSSAAQAVDTGFLRDGMTEASNEFLEAVQIIGLNQGVSEIHKPMTAWLAVTTTVSCAENLLRLENNSVLSKPPVRLSAALDGVIGVAHAMPVSWSKEQLDSIQRHATALLGCVIGHKVQPGIMNCNIFGIFVNLWFASSTARKIKWSYENSIFSDALCFEKNILHFCTLAQLVQIFVRLNQDKLQASDAVVEEDTTEALKLYQACEKIRSSVSLPPLPGNLSPREFLSIIKTSILPYLRCCALFLCHVTGVSGPDVPDYGSEFSSVMKFMGLPGNLSELFDGNNFSETHPIIQNWLSHPAVQPTISTIPNLLSYPALSEVPDFIPLPHHYGELVGAAASFKCPKFASDDSLYPSLCLRCGVMLCSQSYCCQQNHPEKNHLVGACTFHARTCGSGSGMFLRVREATIVLVNDVYRGTFINTPYLDKHGEADKGMRRGDPLYLNSARLLELRKLWLSHGLPEKISYDVESRGFRYLWEWDHL